MTPLEHMTGPVQVPLGLIVHAGDRPSAGCCGMTMPETRRKPSQRRPPVNRDYHNAQNMFLNEIWALPSTYTNVVVALRAFQKAKIIDNHIYQIWYRPVALKQGRFRIPVENYATPF